MELLGIKNFSVLFFSAGEVRGARFERNDKQWKLTRHTSANVDEKDPATAWKSVLKHISSRDGLLFISGALPDGVFFQFHSAELSAKEQRGAIELELPRYLIKLPEKREFQFANSLPGDDLRVEVGVYLFEKKALDGISAKMTQSACRADGFIYPLLALEPGDPEIFIPEIEPEFSYRNNGWQPLNDTSASKAGELAAPWREILAKSVQFPGRDDADFDFFAMLPVLLVARMVASGKFARSRNALAVLPEKLRPVRFRGHITITILLLFLLLINGLWFCARTWGADFRKYRELQSQNKKLKRDIDSARRASKQLHKEQKEMERVLASVSGDPDVVAKLALLSNALPGNVLVSYIRWNDSGIDMTIQSEDAKLDLPRIINPLGFWKIGQLQQRQTGDSAVATISLKLIPINREAAK